MARRRLAALVVEDDPELSELLAEQLALDAAHERIEVAPDGSHALALLDSGLVPGIVLLDLELPKVHGREVLRRLRDDPRFSLTVVVVTGSDGRPGRCDASLPGEVWLPKPFSLGELELAIGMASERLGLETASARGLSRGAIPA